MLKAFVSARWTVVAIDKENIRRRCIDKYWSLTLHTFDAILSVVPTVIICSSTRRAAVYELAGGCMCPTLNDPTILSTNTNGKAETQPTSVLLRPNGQPLQG
jgi:hypothetical protein